MLGFLVCHLDYNTVWNYFASTNQILAMIVLWTAGMYLVKNNRAPWVAVVPATFISAVTMTCVLSSNLYLGGIEFCKKISGVGGLVIAAAFLCLFMMKANKAKTELKK